MSCSEHHKHKAPAVKQALQRISGLFPKSGKCMIYIILNLSIYSHLYIKKMFKP